MSAGGLDVLVVGEINPDIIVADPDLAPIYGQVELSCRQACWIAPDTFTNWDPAEQWDGNVGEMLRVIDPFFPNAAEACRIARVDAPTEAGPILATLGADGRTDGGPTVIVKLGIDGASAYRSDGSVVHVSAMPVQAVDSTGAGDVFDAEFLRAWLDGRELHECLRWDAACGALSTTAIGGVDGQPGLEQFRAALAAWPNLAVDRHR